MSAVSGTDGLQRPEDDSGLMKVASFFGGGGRGEQFPKFVKWSATRSGSERCDDRKSRGLHR